MKGHMDTWARGPERTKTNMLHWHFGVPEGSKPFPMLLNRTSQAKGNGNLPVVVRSEKDMKKANRWAYKSAVVIVSVICRMYHTAFGISVRRCSLRGTSGQSYTEEVRKGTAFPFFSVVPLGSKHEPLVV